MPCADLSRHMEDEIISNPFLEETGTRRVELMGGYRKERENLEQEVRGSSLSLAEHLLNQWHLLVLSWRQKALGEEIIRNLDEKGYLTIDLTEIAENLNAGLEDVEEALEMVWDLEPAGIACRSLEECLLLQVKRLDLSPELKNPVTRIIQNRLSFFPFRKLEGLAGELNLSLVQVGEAVKIIKRLSPNPGNKFSAFQPVYITPDIIFIRKKGRFEVLCSRSHFPEFTINPYYKKLLKDPQTTTETRDYLKKKLESAILFLKSIEQRGATLENLARYLADEQGDFLKKGVSFLRPCRMSDAASRIGVHKSTVSRAVANKYAETPHGLVALKAFFTNSVNAKNSELSPHAVQNKIRRLIKMPPQNSPLSDNRITLFLRAEGIHISRRTVAKYRKKMEIPSSFFRVP